MENPRGYDQSACSLYEPKPMHLNLTEFKFLTMVVNDGGHTGVQLQSDIGGHCQTH